MFPFPFQVCGNLNKIRAGSHYAQVERRSVTFLDQTMSRGEAFGLKKYAKIYNPLLKIVRPLDGSLGQAFCSTQTLLERPNSWCQNFLKVLPPKLFGGNVLWTSTSSVKGKRTNFGHLCILIGPNASPLKVWP
jgi:hypothetical protein